MRHHIAITALIALLQFAPAHAQASPAPAPAPTADARSALKQQLRERVAQKVKTYLAVELSSSLSLDEARSVKLSAAIDAHMKRKQAHREALRAQMDTLKQLVAAGGTDAALGAQVDAIVKKRAAQADETGLIVECAKFLSVKQQAQLVLALPDVMRGVGDMMREAKQQRRMGRADASDDGAGDRPRLRRR